MATKSPPTKLAVGSTHPLWLHGFIALAEQLDGIQIAGFAEDAHTLLDLLESTAPDMLVIDASLVAPVRNLLPPGYTVPRILVVGRRVHAGTRPVFGPACSCGYFGERETATRIAALVGEVARCRLPYAGLAACAGCRVPRSFESPPLPLTERENEIFVRIGWGLGPSEIAAELGIHVKTIEAHRESLKRKLGLGSAADLLDAAYAWRDGDALPSRTSPKGNGRKPA